MKLLLERFALLDGATVGRLGGLCYTLEEPWRENAVDISCIPDGHYMLVPHARGRWRVIVSATSDVPGRSGILIHAGNTLAETTGCILVGMGWMLEAQHCARLLESRRAMDLLRQRLGSEAHDLEIRTRRAEMQYTGSIGRRGVR